MSESVARILTQRLALVTASLSDETLREVVSFAEFVEQRDREREQDLVALASVADCWGDDEPEYTLADILPSDF